MVLGKGWYIRQYNTVLMELVAVVEVARLQANKLAKTKPEPMWSLQVGQSAQGKNYPASIPSFLDFTYDGDRSGPERSLQISRSDLRVQNMARHHIALMANKASRVAKNDCTLGVENQSWRSTRSWLLG